MRFIALAIQPHACGSMGIVTQRAEVFALTSDGDLFRRGYCPDDRVYYWEKQIKNPFGKKCEDLNDPA
jgi:hypothetical protein